MRKHFVIGDIEINYSGFCDELTVRRDENYIRLRSEDVFGIMDVLKDFVNNVEFEKVIREMSKEDLGGKFIAMDKDGGWRVYKNKPIKHEDDYWVDGDVKNYINISDMRLNCYSGEWFESLRVL